MKEIQIVCPECGQEMTPHKWLFKEQWQVAYEAQCERIGLNAVDPCYGSPYVLEVDYRNYHVRVPKPIALIEWEQANPMPTKTMVDVVAEMYAAFIEKGGGE